MVQMLLDLGADIHRQASNSSRSCALTMALDADDPATVALLLKHGADPNCDRTLVSAITAPKKHALEMVKLLEQYGADLHRDVLNEYTDQPMNALSTALDWGQDDVADYLRSKGVKLPAAKAEAKVIASRKDEIIAYFEEHYGPVQKLAVTEIVPTEPSITVHIIPATKEQNCVTLFTTGMSERPMNAPTDLTEFQYGELFIQFPADWKPTRLEDPHYAWPVHWLRMLAQAPHLGDTFLGPFQIVPNGDPPKPIVEKCKFDSMLAVAQEKLVARDGTPIYFYRLMPLYPEERALVHRMDLRALLRSMDRRQISNIVDLKRANAGT